MIGGYGERSVLRQLNPLVGMVIVFTVAITMFISLDPRTALIILVAELPLIALARMSPRQWLMRAWPLAFALVGILLVNLLFSGYTGGRELFELGPFQVTTASLTAAIGVALRILTLALPAIVLFAVIDPTDLADALITQWHAPARIAVGSLAAIRMVPLVMSDLQHVYLSRRTRGISAGGNPITVAAMLLRSLGAVLVSSVRRATRLALAMDSRGFDSGIVRTVARESRWRRRDSIIVALAIAVCVIAIAVSIVGGTFRTIFS